LSVVCRSCGQEVSPYVTECPYCGTRLRKRAPKLERKEGGELRARETRADRRRRKAAERRERRASGRLGALAAAERPYATILAIAAPAVLLVVERATNLGVDDLGAIVGPVGSEWWRYLTAPWVFDDIGYLFCVALALAIFMPAIEERVGPLPALLLAIACGSLGMLAADGLDQVLADGDPLAAGGNGVALGVLCAWVVMRDGERRSNPTLEYDRIAVVVAAAVLLLLPVFDDLANVWAGLVGALVGAACGFSAAVGRRREA
jgi:membrane associated rhomboid family serine protease